MSAARIVEVEEQQKMMLAYCWDDDIRDDFNWNDISWDDISWSWVDVSWDDVSLG